MTNKMIQLRGAAISHLAISALMLCLTACGSEKKIPDEDLGNLVVSEAKSTLVTVAQDLESNPSAVLEALARSHTANTIALGAHRLHGTSSVKILGKGEVMQSLSHTLQIQVDKDDRFVATVDNSENYGRHAIYDGQNLYLRPRFGMYHMRPPIDDEEPRKIRDEMALDVAAYLELVRGSVSVIAADQSPEHEGRSVKRFSLRLSKEVADKPTETLAHRLWRNEVKVERLDGQVALDEETLVPLQVSLSGAVSYVRDNEPYELDFQAEQTVSQIGTVLQVRAPAADLILQIPPRRSERRERDMLLRHIAPPSRSAPTLGNRVTTGGKKP